MARRKLPWFRVLLLAASIASIVVVTVVRARIAQAAEMAIDALSLMTRPHGSSKPPESLVVNGLTFEVRSGATRAPLPRVLDDFSAHCRRTEVILGALQSSMSGVVQRLAGRLSGEAGVRFQREGRGLLACLVSEDGPQVPASERLGTFAETLDISLFGRVQLVIAQSAGETTTYAVLRSRGPLPLRSAFPLTGDAPGRDPEALSRMPGSVRLVSASTDGASPSIVVYETPSSVLDDPAAHYLRTLQDRRWVTVPRLQSRGRVVATKEGRVTIVSVSANEERILTTIVTL